MTAVDHVYSHFLLKHSVSEHLQRFPQKHTWEHIIIPVKQLSCDPYQPII